MLDVKYSVPVPERPPMTSPDALPPPPWRRPTAKPRQQLTVDAVVAVALRIMAGEGLEAVTMRRVAQDLNTGPASLYAHVRNKQDLHELMLDKVFARVAVPAPDPGRWREQLTAVAIEVTRIMLDNPGVARIAMQTLIPTSAGQLVLVDGIFGLLRAGGIPDRYIPPAADALALYCTAYAYEASLAPTTEAGQAEVRRRVGEIEEYLDSLPPQRLPHLRALRSELSGDNGEHFAFALDVFITGLAAYAKR